eukprot:TRINITY_DN6977_c0_g2_i2.p1 TRINITY_DN6977_c0_g2~~TRINITY_DN6977_c0_g2_i2.p1  ORF type:complete len:166 (-),score=33.24 TRINITY_DN6977_c0_g2_i2:183-680(-)
MESQSKFERTVKALILGTSSKSVEEISKKLFGAQQSTLWQRPTDLISEVVETSDEIVKYLMWVFDVAQESYYRIMSAYVGLITNLVFVIDLSSPNSIDSLLKFLGDIKKSPRFIDTELTLLTYTGNTQGCSEEEVEKIIKKFGIGKCISLDGISSSEDFLVQLGS